MPDRLVVDLDRDGQVAVSSFPADGFAEEVSRTLLAWPLDDEALEDLRWYLEDYLLAPYGVWEERGPAIRERLPEWGKQVFGSVFADGPARFAYERARDRGLELVFRSADPALLGLPWELMQDGEGPVALRAGGISRTLNVADSAGTLDVPGGKLRVLMVISRPDGDADVSYQMVARPLLERLDAVRGEVSLTVLRPPTFDALRDAVRQAAESGEPFHVVHFDGHGAMLDHTAGRGGLPGSATRGRLPGSRPDMLTGPGGGVLAFEKPSGGGSDLVGAAQVARVLADGRVPVVVLNACQSGAVGKELEASVATALLDAGCAAVVAMAYSVYAVAAAEFMAAFYESLFAGTSVGQAVTSGRKRLFDHDARPTRKGDLPLADWLVPVHYERREVRFPTAKTTRPPTKPSLDEALDLMRAATEATPAQDPLAAIDGVFVGRDDLFYQLETAARLKRVVLLTGPGGTGKTELAKGFARWWRDTGGVDDPRLVLWHSFEPGLATFGLDGVVTEIGLEVFGADFARLDAPQRLEAVKDLLAQYRVLLVWDNFESVREMPDPTGGTPALDAAGCAALQGFLAWVRDHSASAVLITSRSREDWLGDVRRIGVGGLNRPEAAEYAGHLLAPYPSAQRRREDRSFGDLLEWLDGHPLAMRLTLPRLNTTDPAALLSDLRGTATMSAADTQDADRHTSLAASIAYSYAHLSDRTRRLLPAVSLFHGVADQDVLATFTTVEGVPSRFSGVSPAEWAAVLADAARVGLLTGLGNGMYRVHPALPGYLAAEWRAGDPRGYELERQACEDALCEACADFSRWLAGQIASGDAALAYALIGWQRRTLGAMLGHALDHRAWFAVGSIVQPLDDYWDSRGLSAESGAWADRILTAAGAGQVPSEDTVGSLWLYTTNRQAIRLLDTGRLEQAAQAYRRALAYLDCLSTSDWTRGSTAVVYQQLGRAALMRGRLGEGEGWYRKALAIQEEFGNRPGMAGSYHQLGRVAQDGGRLGEAEGWYRKSLAIREGLGDRPGMAGSYHQLGIAAQDGGRLGEAEGWYRKSLAIREELGDRPGMAGSYHQLGRVAQDGGRLGEAEGWYRKSLAIREELGNRPGMAGSYHQLGIAAQDGGRLGEAEGWYRKALDIEMELGDLPDSAMTYGQLGLLAEDRQQPQQALEWMVRCVALFDQFPHPVTGPGPGHLARLTRQLGLSALEEAWRQVTGQPVPQEVSDYITSHPGEQPAGDP